MKETEDREKGSVGCGQVESEEPLDIENHMLLQRERKKCNITIILFY